MIGQIQLGLQRQAKDVIQIRFGNGNIIVCRHGCRLGIGQGYVGGQDINFGLGAHIVLGRYIIQVTLQVIDGFMVYVP